jgi:hypothetical protein
MSEWWGGRWKVVGTAKRATETQPEIKYSRESTGSYASLESTVHAAIRKGATHIELDKIID